MENSNPREPDTLGEDEDARNPWDPDPIDQPAAIVIAPSKIIGAYHFFLAIISCLFSICCYMPPRDHSFRNLYVAGPLWLLASFIFGYWALSALLSKHQIVMTPDGITIPGRKFLLWRHIERVEVKPKPFLGFTSAGVNLHLDNSEAIFLSASMLGGGIRNFLEAMATMRGARTPGSELPYD